MNRRRFSPLSRLDEENEDPEAVLKDSGVAAIRLETGNYCFSGRFVESWGARSTTTLISNHHAVVKVSAIGVHWWLVCRNGAGAQTDST